MAQPASAFYVSPGYWTVQRALEELPETPEFTIEVFDGSLVVSPRPSTEPQFGLGELCHSRNRAAREIGLVAYAEINLVLGEDLASPDITVVRRIGKKRVWVDARDAVLVVEIMSPNHKWKDRRDRPDKYAEFEIPYYMRVELQGDD